MVILVIVLLLLLLLSLTVDVVLFLRVIVTCTVARYFRRKIDVLEPSSIYGIVLPRDADALLDHMNNSRFLREYDFGRWDLGTRTGMLEYIWKLGGNIPVSAVHMRYRLPALMFARYKIVTRIVYWEPKFIYLDQRLVTLKDDIVRVGGYVKVACVKFDADEVIKTLFPHATKPEMPADLKSWNETCELSREMMKKDVK